jgi:hypothetical protein
MSWVGRKSHEVLGSRFPGSRFGFMGSWVHGFVVRGFVGSWFVGSWVRNAMARSRRLTVMAVAVACLLPVVFAACAKTVVNTVDDLTITARVKTVLLNDQQMDATKIDVETTQGIVTLSGTVNSSADGARAIELARQASGVKQVKSTLRISSQHVAQGAAS